MINAAVYPVLASFLGPGVDVSMDYTDSPVLPYCIWSLIAGNPDVNLDQPPSDTHAITVDVYSADEAQAMTLIANARSAIESIGDVETVQSLGYDPVPKHWRWTLQGTVMLNR